MPCYLDFENYIQLHEAIIINDPRILNYKNFKVGRIIKSKKTNPKVGHIVEAINISTMQTLAGIITAINNKEWHVLWDLSKSQVKYILPKDKFKYLGQNKWVPELHYMVLDYNFYVNHIHDQRLKVDHYEPQIGQGRWSRKGIRDIIKEKYPDINPESSDLLFFENNSNYDSKFIRNSLGFREFNPPYDKLSLDKKTAKNIKNYLNQVLTTPQLELTTTGQAVKVKLIAVEDRKYIFQGVNVKLNQLARIIPDYRLEDIKTEPDNNIILLFLKREQLLNWQKNIEKVKINPDVR